MSGVQDEAATLPRSPRSPGTHTVGSRGIGSITLHRDPRTGTQYIGNWASRVSRQNHGAKPQETANTAINQHTFWVQATTYIEIPGWRSTESKGQEIRCTSVGLGCRV